MWLAELLVDLLEETAPPGHTKFSLAVATDCAPDALECEGAIRSPFYGAWARKETREEGAIRYRVIAAALAQASRKVLCKDEDGIKLEGCEPFKTKQRWDGMYLSVAATAVATYESGFREDVMVGRGQSKKPSPDGGQGRGPSGEACLMQIHPVIAWRFAPDVPADLRLLAKNGDAKAREEIALSLVGSDEEALVRCFTTGMRMLVHARGYCAWESPKVDGAWAMYSLYGTGNSCSSANNGKTAMRERLYEVLLDKAREGRRKLRATDRGPRAST